MKQLFQRAKELRIENCNDDWDCPIAVDILCKEYPNIPRDIMKWFIVRHANQGEEIMDGFDNIDAHKIVVVQKYITNKELQDKDIIQNAPFANYGNITEVYKGFNKELYLNTYFTNGTWQAPIIALEQNNKLYVIDGTCRFWHMQISLFNQYKFINNKHLINIFTYK